VVAQARNGREALELFDQHQPQVVFLDVHMPGLSGIDAARGIGRRAEIVFVTAYEQYAVQAFEQGAIDYLVKPFDEPGWPTRVQRLRGDWRRWRRWRPTLPDALLDRLADELRAPAAPAPVHLQWIKASIGPACG
jgi:DNA-binding LytR/AlgR family response regulator